MPPAGTPGAGRAGHRPAGHPGPHRGRLRWWGYLAVAGLAGNAALGGWLLGACLLDNPAAGVVFQVALGLGLAVAALHSTGTRTYHRRLRWLLQRRHNRCSAPTAPRPTGGTPPAVRNPDDCP